MLFIVMENARKIKRRCEKVRGGGEKRRRSVERESRTKALAGGGKKEDCREDVKEFTRGLFAGMERPTRNGC
jgi:hypothetical protein